jgi:alpha-galactosidase
MAAVCNSCLGVIDLGARAAVERSLEAATHAVMLDPLTAASCTPEEIRSMVKEMFIAERDFLPGFE